MSLAGLDLTRWGFRWWAALCEPCGRETTDEPKCRDCGHDLEGAPKRGPLDPALAPDMLAELWPKRDSLEADD